MTAANSRDRSGAAIRIAINAGNTVLAQRNPATGVFEGIAISLGFHVAARLGSSATFVAYGSANDILQATDRDEWDIAFLASDPSRADVLEFSVPYLRTRATLLAWRDGSHRSVSDLDSAGLRIGATRNAAYARVLKRQLAQATIVEAATAAAALDMFLRERLDAVAGIRDALEAFALRQPETVVLPDNFATIDQVIAISRRSDRAIEPLNEIIEDWIEASPTGAGQPV